MITLLYHAKSVGPVCKRLAALAPGLIQAIDDNTQLAVGDVMVRWGSTSTHHVANLEINRGLAVAVARSKPQSRTMLGDLAPATWSQLEDMRLPCIVRPCYHHAGSKFFVCYTLAKLARAIKRCRPGWYASEIIDKAAEYRVFILHGRVVVVSQRFPANPGDMAWNLAMGGRLVNVKYKEWPIAACQVALQGAARLGLDWAAMDVCLGTRQLAPMATEPRPWVFEANTAPGLRNPHTMKQIVKGLLWLEDHKPPKPAPPEETRWQRLLHPALRTLA